MGTADAMTMEQFELALRPGNETASSSEGTSAFDVTDEYKPAPGKEE